MAFDYDPAEMGRAVATLLANGTLGLVLMRRPNAAPGELQGVVDQEIERRRKGGRLYGPDHTWANVLTTSFAEMGDDYEWDVAGSKIKLVPKSQPKPA